MAWRALTMEIGRRKIGPLVKCRARNYGSISSPSLVYEKSICLCVQAIGDPYDRREWYMLHLSSDKDKHKEEEEKKGDRVLQMPTPELRGSYLAFHHNERHQGQGENPPQLLPLITKTKEGKYGFFGAGHAVVGSTIYHLGGSLESFGSRNVTYFDASRPKGGWKRGPRTICGRTQAAVAALHGRLYVFGCDHEHTKVWAEFLDTTLIDLEEEDKGKCSKVEWSPLPDCSGPLGFMGLFAAALDHGKYSGKILVGSRETGAICLYDVRSEVWETLRIKILLEALNSNPIVVGTTIYWISFWNKHLCAYDIVQRKEFSMPIGDFKILQLLDASFGKEPQDDIHLMHLAGDIFCVLWVDDNTLHCTNLRVCTTVMDAYVLCCHSYSFNHPICDLLHCASVQPYLFGSNAAAGGGDG